MAKWKKLRNVRKAIEKSSRKGFFLFGLFNVLRHGFEGQLSFSCHTLWLYFIQTQQAENHKTAPPSTQCA